MALQSADNAIGPGKVDTTLDDLIGVLSGNAVPVRPGDLLSALTAGLDNILAPLIDQLLSALGLSLNGVDAELLGAGYGKA
ncbi:hypothetical protein ACFO0U_13700 [Chromohalobacter sarecensis]|uniref:DUF937 domain-containing protein n=1 Tax=Chromohalobacter sarecensis TaxID=245294 RepID=A0ABV9D470_9GAMM|nr:hypothetical protein [Chromohalobacter sarecensis]MCK0714411.1 hypothetical protein [Chromohalobacter sarecensis]